MTILTVMHTPCWSYTLPHIYEGRNEVQRLVIVRTLR